jgi:hypothetical protein
MATTKRRQTGSTALLLVIAAAVILITVYLVYGDRGETPAARDPDPTSQGSVPANTPKSPAKNP